MTLKFIFQTQITNYGLAGLCDPHIDPHGIQEVEGELPPNKKGLLYTGDMLGTFMAWLADTPAGGRTAYLEPGYEGLVTPEKGAAAFWYDLTSELRRDKTSRHGGCPVIKGSKWILNKWIYAYDNFAKFPCQIQQGAPFNIPDSTHYY